MTREHLVQDIENVLELVNRAEDGPDQSQEAQKALWGLYRHIQNEEDVPATVEGCLREAATSAEPRDGQVTTATWRSARACLEAALEFARGE